MKKSVVVRGKLPPYDEFRTGLTFSEVRKMLWSASADPKEWRYKRRSTVLGLWHQLKREMYDRAMDELNERPPSASIRGPARRRV